MFLIIWLVICLVILYVWTKEEIQDIRAGGYLDFSPLWIGVKALVLAVVYLVGVIIWLIT